MLYVDIDKATNTVSWDRYFAYLRTIENQLPSPLREYATTWSHYSLDGENTLHDAWLRLIEFGLIDQSLSIEFLGPRHDRRHRFDYINVKQYIVDVDVQFSAGDRDVFVQEFRVQESLMMHEVLFSNFRRLVVKAEKIVPTIGLML